MSNQPGTGYPRSPIPSTASYDSSSVSSAPSPQPPHTYGGFLGTSSRPPSGQLPQLMQLPPGQSLGPGPYQQSYHSTSPRGPHGLELMNASNGSSSGTPGAQSPQTSSSNIQAQKRAYRQRRKDPSCDACRERKVKCDATETTSCSECSSRSVKCQFTKETNRRMSSIKQVQDLEKHIASVKKENAQLRAILNLREGQMDIDMEEPQKPGLQLPAVGSHPERRKRPQPPHDLTRVRKNLRNHSRGIFKPPAPYRQMGSQGQFNPRRPELPPKHISDHLLSSYYACIHTVIPILHWPTFEQEYETVYKAGSLQAAPPVWASLLFAVLAVGVMFSTDPSISRPNKGKEFIENSRMLLDMWNDEFGIDHARTAILTSIFLSEINMKSAAWTWLGSAVRISQDIGLQHETGPWPIIEGEMRRRVWWGIYVWDRLVSMEMGRPLLIEDDDCDVPLPTAIDDHYIHDVGTIVPNGAQPITNSLLPTIHVVRSISQLIKTLKATTISQGTLATFDTHFKACMASFPATCQVKSLEPLEIRMLSPLVYLLSARIVLHRHNLSTISPPEARVTAIDQCVRAALDTSQFISRTMQIPSRHSFAAAATAMLCTHLWRCTLFLLFTSRFIEAQILIRASGYIGSSREVNIACGRNLAFFLEQLLDRKRSGAVRRIEEDEELMVYVSGDLQASIDGSWAWQGSETGMQLNASTSSTSSSLSPTLARPRENALDERSGSLTEAEGRDWGGWERVEYLLSLLTRGDVPGPAAQGPPPGAYMSPIAREPEGRVNLAPIERREQSRSKERLSIANII